MTDEMSGYYLLNTDGGMMNDGHREHGDPPGEAAIAVVLRDGRDRPVAGGQLTKSIGRKTNAEAEYLALIEGLRFAGEKGVTRIRVYVDSEFVVDQMNERSAPRHDHIRTLHNEALEISRQFDSFRISWIPRERNREADALVRSALS